MLGKPAEDGSQVCWGLSRAEDHLSHADPQRSVVINIGESQVLERQMLEVLHRLIGRQLAFSNLLEERLDGF
jgi:hypothetical protein